jgi:hypothetical protein
VFGCASLLIQDSFERGKAFKLFTTRCQLHRGDTRFIETTDEVPPFDGSYVLKISVTDGMAPDTGRSCAACPPDHATERNEISFGDPLNLVRQNELWYQFSFYIPSTYPKDTLRNTIHQYKEWQSEIYDNHPVCGSISPFYTIKIYPFPRYFVFEAVINHTEKISGSDNLVFSCNHARIKKSSLHLNYDTWYTVRTHMIYNKKDNGVIETWIDRK